MAKLKSISFFGLSMFLLLVFSVQAQEVSSLIDNVKRLEKQLSALERQVYQGGASAVQAVQSATPSVPSVFSKSGGGVSPTSSQIETLEQEIQRVTGMVEDLSLKVNQQQKENEAFKKDVEFRLNEIEKKGASQLQESQDKALKEKQKNQEELVAGKKKDNPSSKEIGSKKELGILETNVTAGAEKALELPPSKPEKIVGGGSQALPTKEVAEMYAVGMDLLKEKNYAAARKAFEGFMENHIEDPLAGQAQYWLGEIHLAEGDYKKASVAFLKSYRDFPKNTKQSDSLLKLAESLNKLQKNKEACAILEKLLTDFPNANQGVKSLATKNKAEWGC